ncbi:MAG: magnesium/cobalt efflux protein, partial [Verrucomicrobia bacterium]
MVAIFACIFVSFVFSGIESGLLSVNRVRLHHYAKSGNEVATTLHSLLK